MEGAPSDETDAFSASAAVELLYAQEPDEDTGEEAEDSDDGDDGQLYFDGFDIASGKNLTKAYASLVDGAQRNTGGVAGGGAARSAAGSSSLLAHPRVELGIMSSARGELRRSESAGDKAPRHTGRDDRATTELVMDPRTRLILFKMLSSGFMSEIHGCVSTGKVRISWRERVAGFCVRSLLLCGLFCALDPSVSLPHQICQCSLTDASRTARPHCTVLQEANVYHATAQNGDELAIKVRTPRRQRAGSL